MKKTLLIAGALLALTASMASAGGINLSWGDCGAFGTAQKNFACTSNSGTNLMTASVVSPVPLDQLVGQEGVIDVQTNQAAVSSWWLFNVAGLCRAQTVLSSNFNFTANVNCVDPWSGLAAGGINEQVPPLTAPNRVRIRTICAINPGTAIDDATEYYMFAVAINNTKSTGTGSCPGCADGACIVLNSIKLVEPAGVGDYDVSNPLLRQHILWQGGAGNVTGGCPQATPTKSATWGSVKSLYR